MVAHNSVSAQVNCKHRRQQFDAIHDPLATVFEIKACLFIYTAQEGTAHTAGDAVVVRRIFD